MTRHSKKIPHADWIPTSHAAAPAAFPPHPPLQSGGWYRASIIEAPGPGRPPVVTHTEKSPWLAVVLSVLFGPLGLCYLSAGAGLTATALAAVVVGAVGPPALLLLWPLSVAAAVWRALWLRGHQRAAVRKRHANGSVTVRYSFGTRRSEIELMQYR